MNDDTPSIDEVREALRSLRGETASVDDVIALWNASELFEIQLLPGPAMLAIMATQAIRRDLDNGGMDQVVWNHGVANSRQFATAFRAIGMIENAELIERLVAALEAQDKTQRADPVKQFFAFRSAVEGPELGVLDPRDELDEPLLEYVIAHAHALPDPDGELPLAAQ